LKTRTCQLRRSTHAKGTWMKRAGTLASQWAVNRSARQGIPELWLSVTVPVGDWEPRLSCHWGFELPNSKSHPGLGRPRISNFMNVLTVENRPPKRRLARCCRASLPTRRRGKAWQRRRSARPRKPWLSGWKWKGRLPKSVVCRRVPSYLALSVGGIGGPWLMRCQLCLVLLLVFVDLLLGSLVLLLFMLFLRCRLRFLFLPILLFLLFLLLLAHGPTTGARAAPSPSPFPL